MGSTPLSKPVLAIITAAFGFSWGFVIVKSVTLPPVWIAAYRLALGATVLSTASALTKTKFPQFSKWVVGAGIFFGLHQILYIEATHRTSIAVVTVLGAAKPLLVAFLGIWLLKERPPKAFYGWAVVAAVGVVLLVAPKLMAAETHWQGDAIALVNLFVLALYYIFVKQCRVSGDAPTLSLTASIQCIGFMTVIVPALVTGFKLPSLTNFGLVALIVVGPANAHLLVNWALKKVNAAVAMLLLGLIPALASLWAYLILGETLTWIQICGMAIVFVAIGFAQMLPTEDVA